MASLNMNGPYDFNTKTINQVVAQKIGNYALGSKNSVSGLTVSYVGRSDNDLLAELLMRTETHKHTHFKFSYAASVKEAFERECNNYHDFSPPENKIHPAVPKDTNYRCPKGD